MFRRLIKYKLLALCLVLSLHIQLGHAAIQWIPGAGPETLCVSVSNGIEGVQPGENDLRQRLMRYFDEHLSAPLAKWINRSIRFTYDSTLAFVLACLILYFLLSTVFIILFILLHNIVLAIRTKKYRKLRAFYQGNLIDFIFNSDLGAFANLACFRRKMGRKVLIEEIMKMQKDVNGEAHQTLRDIYVALDLDRRSIRKIIRRGWPGKIDGIREVSDMNIRSALSIIGRYPSSKNELLRSEAQAAIVRLNDKDPFYFLDGFKAYLSNYEQLKIYNIVSRHNIAVPDFSRWFDSQNESVVTFAIRMAVLFNQGYTEKQLVKLLDHTRPGIRKEAIIAIGALELIQCDTRLMDIYAGERGENKIAILKSLQKIPDERQIGFLAGVTDENDFDRQFEAVKALLQIGELGKIRLINIEKERDGQFKNIVKHLYDGRI